ncbi:MAG: dinitrogenase iron-molybdenum cofactor biosynthesis protein, partial [Anaerolineae bacterium]|nr:dinitrogenase iron-molybdenum cofactor biosynthesis protein [Anaerolineae bacterium]
GSDPASHDRHTRMTEAIRDCEVVVCAGMGMGAYTSLQSFNIRPIITDLSQIDQALQAFLAGKLEDKPERLH